MGGDLVQLELLLEGEARSRLLDAVSRMDCRSFRKEATLRLYLDRQAPLRRLTPLAQRHASRHADLRLRQPDGRQRAPFRRSIIGGWGEEGVVREEQGGLPEVLGGWLSAFCPDLGQQCGGQLSWHLHCYLGTVTLHFKWYHFPSSEGQRELQFLLESGGTWALSTQAGSVLLCSPGGRGGGSVDLQYLAQGVEKVGACACWCVCGVGGGG